MTKVQRAVPQESASPAILNATHDRSQTVTRGTTTIEWTNVTWNPVNGCTKISPGCKHCYAERMARRHKGMGTRGYENGFAVTCNEHLLDKPYSWKKSRMVFVNSMGDLFHEDVPQEYREEVFEVMNDCSQHTFQVLTKRPEELVRVHDRFDWTSNIWMGVTVETAKYLHRVDLLRQVPAEVRFLSCEPLLGPLGQFDLNGIHWVIAGGESGPGARPMDEAWVTDLRDWCVQCQVPFFFKQWGGVNKKAAGRLLEGREWNQMPRPSIHLN